MQPVEIDPAAAEARALDGDRPAARSAPGSASGSAARGSVSRLRRTLTSAAIMVAVVGTAVAVTTFGVLVLSQTGDAAQPGNGPGSTMCYDGRVWATLRWVRRDRA